jgi:TolB-like protein/class 3 adenylate cyclase/Flp pilus assembly protein TadD
VLPRKDHANARFGSISSAAFDLNHSWSPKTFRDKRRAFYVCSRRVNQKWDDYSPLNSAPPPKMSSEVKKEVALEIAHVLFIDIVGYSKLSINEQRAVVDKLNQIVRQTEEFRRADGAGRLIKIPVGDGMALVFYDSPETPVECALEISRLLKQRPELRLRMGVHSGAVSGVVDVNERANVAGVGINIAQRVMDCADAGHILLSKRVAEDLEQYTHWQPHLHHLGECEVKHGVRVWVVNLYTDDLGNPAVPRKVAASRAADAKRKRAALRWISLGALVLLVAVIAIGFLVFRNKSLSLSVASAIAAKSIAVLPFENLSEDKENAYFTDGVQDEILTDLAKIADLKVISRTSVMLYKAGNPRNLREIGKQLGIAHVLEGSVQRAGGKVRVNAQLIDARTDKHLWARSYDRELADVFAIETEVAQLIANELQAKLSASEKVSIAEKPTQDLAAYDFYVRATPLVEWIAYSSTQEKDLSTAVDLLNQAITRDPAFLLAYCRLAEAQDAFYFQGVDHTPARLALAKSAIDSAFHLKPDSGEAHLALASHLYFGYFDYDRARAQLAIAQRTLPNNAEVFWLSGIIDRRQGRWSDAVHNMKRAGELDPRNVSTLVTLAVFYWQLRDYEQLNNTLTRVLALDPNRFDARTWRAAIDMDRRADPQPLRAEIEKILAEDPAQAESDDIKRSRFILAMVERDFAAADRAAAALPQKNSFGDDFGFSRDFWVGVVARAKGDAAAARAAFTAARTDQEKDVRAQPENGPFLAGLGVIDAGLGRKEEALWEGRRAIELTPIAKNSLHGLVALTDFAMICAWTGERDVAIEQLEALAKVPGGPTYGELRLSPVWDSLRGDPRFEKVMAETAKPVKLD